jgi:hypothetical protein
VVKQKMRRAKRILLHGIDRIRRLPRDWEVTAKSSGLSGLLQVDRDQLRQVLPLQGRMPRLLFDGSQHHERPASLDCRQMSAQPADIPVK